MAFPEVPRVIYEINPLDEVSCQLKFPPILRIDVQPPVEFQEAIREEFPQYRQEATANVTIQPPAGQPGAVVPYIAQGVLGTGQTHVFETVDRCWQVKLSRDALSLVCRTYDRWENFSARLSGPLNTLVSVYRPTFFGHVCLRYRDLIRKWLVEIPNDTPWGELIHAPVAGPYGSSDVAADVEGVVTRSVIRLPDGIGRLEANYGLALEQGANRPEKRTVFRIDAHLYKEPRTEFNNVMPILSALNRQARFFFRWCITDRLHAALRPRDP